MTAFDSNLRRARHIAKKMRRPHFSYSECLSAAYLAVMNRQQKSPDTPISYQRLRGAIVDDMREMGYLIRVREKGRNENRHRGGPIACDIPLVHSSNIDSADEVSHILSKLPESVREMFRLYFWEGMLMKDIAKRFGITTQGVSNNIAYNLRKLRSSGTLIKIRRTKQSRGGPMAYIRKRFMFEKRIIGQGDLCPE